MTDTTPRGQLKRQDKAMTREEAEAFLSSAFCGRTGTLGPDGYPYVVPNLFTWQGGQVYLHTARYEGQFLTNVRFHEQVSFEVDEPGEIFPYGHVECDTSVSYRSVIVFGRIRIVEDMDEKVRFYRAFMTKYAPEDSWGREKDSLPRVNGTIVYAITPESITGKQGHLPGLSDRWPAKNDTASPGWQKRK
ncbi:pyridoxamine 5'-phosphate oxidase family protein [Deinococcus deserti]|uniref:Putative pyridoxamine 5-phosphate oxidase n=1 Tax=Deinococcus deserti (strain DSM 17065 / CIP 109153 / LMG 22923 / VCD115) TaxID=546414 RepID=C1D3G6_DEIDV|nr:pyridoxamine 5'-phosphate oxidase family protein [Deinococcus deserti]ACO48045.1 putative pyridoxamine 5-phosphate oxidase [Deinococcus deserti VCD115]